MFTGIIAGTGSVRSSARVSGDLQLTVEADIFDGTGVAIGDSVAVNGVCLTVIRNEGSFYQFDVSRESLAHTLIDQWQPGTRLNLELALTPSDRLGGHFVSGHVDGLARLVKLKQDARSWRLGFEIPTALSRYIARKGSVALDGISLTVNSVKNDYFDVNIVPHTWQETNLSDRGCDDQVHIEVDLIARYLERLFDGDGGRTSTVDNGNIAMDLLKERGFA